MQRSLDYLNVSGMAIGKEEQLHQVQVLNSPQGTTLRNCSLMQITA
jgi:hypothetical protein